MTNPEVPLAIDTFHFDTNILDYWINLVGISTLAGSCAAIISDDMRTFRGMMRCSVLALLAGYIVGSLCQGYEFKEGTTHALVGLAGFMANYLFIFIIKLAKMALDNPMDIVNFLLGFIPWRKKE